VTNDPDPVRPPHLAALKLAQDRCRSLRSMVYGDCSDDGWEHVRETWMQPENLRWLEEQSRLPPFFAPLVYWKNAPVLRERAGLQSLGSGSE
jgi:hypothetical protein